MSKPAQILVLEPSDVLKFKFKGMCFDTTATLLTTPLLLQPYLALWIYYP